MHIYPIFPGAEQSLLKGVHTGTPAGSSGKDRAVINLMSSLKTLTLVKAS